ncbi:MAG: efflux RND transporter permease subunit [Patescibacteria group bacterium]
MSCILHSISACSSCNDFEVHGIELNTLVLFSMVLVIGLVVDPTIVFLESLHRYRNQGYRSREAAIKTINSVGWGVALSAVTNFLVFVPFGVVSGFFGQIIKYIPITVIPAVIASFLVPAIFFMPVAAKWLKRKRIGCY